MYRKQAMSIATVLSFSLAFMGCATVPEPIPERDLAKAGAFMQTATVLDTHLYQPQAKLKGCEAQSGAFPLAKPTPQLVTAYEKAKEYHDQAKGLGVIVIKDGNILFEDYNPPAKGESLTTSASMMKSVLGLLTGIAVEKGAIKSVDDPVSKYLEEWKGDPRGDITIRQLLTMSSGLGKSNFMKLLLSADINAVAFQTPLAAEPGSKFAYNNAVSQILGIIVDRQIRKKGYRDFRDFMQRELWCPLGNGEAELWIDREGGSPRFYAGLHASLRDWARVGELIRNKGRVADRQIVSEKWVADMTTPSAANPQYGYQLWLGGSWTEKRRYADDNPVTVPHSAPYTSKDVAFFDGFGGQRVYVVPSKGLTIARTGLVNMGYDDAVIVNAVLSGLE